MYLELTVTECITTAYSSYKNNIKLCSCLSDLRTSKMINGFSETATTCG